MITSQSPKSVYAKFEESAKKKFIETGVDLNLLFGSSGDHFSIRRNKTYLHTITLNPAFIHKDVKANTSIKIFGKEFSAPIGSASISGLVQSIKEDAIFKIMTSLSELNLITCIGYPVPDFLPSLDRDTASRIVWFVKPLPNADYLKIVDAIDVALALGIDIESCRGVDIDGRVIYDKSWTAKSIMELREIKESIDLPLIIKGIISIDDAKKISEIGADGVVISNHGGRVLDYLPSPVEMLPDIKNQLQKGIVIFVDGGIKSGYDVFKALALGADVVLFFRPIVLGLAFERGIQEYFNFVTNEFRRIMEIMGLRNVKEINTKHVSVRRARAIARAYTSAT